LITIASVLDIVAAPDQYRCCCNWLLQLLPLLQQLMLLRPVPLLQPLSPLQLPLSRL